MRKYIPYFGRIFLPRETRDIPNGRDVKKDKNGSIRRVCSFLTPEEVQHMPIQKIVGISIKDIELIFKTPIHGLSVPKIIYQNCAIVSCKETQIELHHIKKLARCFIGNGGVHFAPTKAG